MKIYSKGTLLVKSIIHVLTHTTSLLLVFLHSSQSCGIVCSQITAKLQFSTGQKLQVKTSQISKDFIRGLSVVSRSRSEQAPGSGFHPRVKSDKICCGFLGPAWCNKKVYPERQVPCGSYELSVRHVAHNNVFRLNRVLR